MSIRRAAVLAALIALGVAAQGGSSPATFSGIDGRIVFSQFKGGGFNLYSANPDGSQVNRLTNSGKDRASFVSDWSPDGSRIAFDSDRVDADGRKDVVQIYVMDADGNDETQLTVGPGFHGTPGWSPDGSRIALDADWGKRSLNGLWTIPVSDPDGVTQADAQRVTTTPKNADFDSEPQFSPDGQTIVFTRFRSPSESAIHLVNLDGTNLRRITDWKLNASDPDFSPDGQILTYDSGDGGRPGSTGDIYTANADGTGPKKLTNSKKLTKDGPFKLANNPVFSPSGTRIMFTQFLDELNELRVFDVDGTNREVVLSSKRFANKVDWGVSPPG